MRLKTLKRQEYSPTKPKTEIPKWGQWTPGVRWWTHNVTCDFVVA